MNSPEVGIGILSLLDIGKSPKDGDRAEDNFIDPSHKAKANTGHIFLKCSNVTLSFENSVAKLGEHCEHDTRPGSISLVILIEEVVSHIIKYILIKKIQ